ncbi:tropinone reductase homolog At1g07440 [Telopea speciosissima]|uniref:tropinone reductase homolog At1g07440 n=1 Tax=Telopea speciosissima TaxID=54955 RepID=UPI001CC6817D|nr:tropinone reductase homolog At1g07440 [Telopea speciosissima]
MVSRIMDDRWSLNGMTALVTDGTSTIGFIAIVEELAQLGAIVHTYFRNEVERNEFWGVWQRKGFQVTGSVYDASSRRPQREKLMEIVSSVFHGKLNILVSFVFSTFSFFFGYFRLSIGKRLSA